MEDEDRLVAVRSTASALRKEEEELKQRIKEKAVVRTLEQKLETARETDKAKFEESLRTADEEIQAVSAKHDKLATELAIRDSALSECQTRNQHLLEELVSYRAESFELRGTTAAFQEQYEAQARRGANLYNRFQSLAHHSMRQEATIDALHAEVEMLRGGWAKGAGMSPHNMHGPVGGSGTDYIASYAPPMRRCTSDSEPVPMTEHMQPYSAHQVPAGQPQISDAMEQDEEQSGSPTRSDAAQSGDTFHTAQASDHDQAASEAWVEEEERAELAREFSLGDDLQETVMQPSCISKCEQKDMGVTETGAEGSTVRALPAVNLTSNITLLPHPVQASRGVCKEEDAATTPPDIAQEPIADVAVVPASDDVQSSAAAEASAPLPTPPREVVYITPLPPGHLAAMSTNVQQTYNDALHRVCLAHPPSTPAPTPAGVYVTPMPPQLHSSSMHEVKEQRANKRVGARVGSRTGPADVQSIGSGSSTSQQAVANSQGAETHEAQKQAKKNAKKARKKRASQQRANAGS
ncbi:hypothetical protein ABBQ38_004585 [Trebouxia sp. C0009 RCD-2024]